MRLILDTHAFLWADAEPAKLSVCVNYFQFPPLRMMQFRPISVRIKNRRLTTADCGLRTVDCGLRTVDCGLRTVNCGLRTVNCGLWTVDCGLWTVDPSPFPIASHARLRYRNDMNRGRQSTRCSADYAGPPPRTRPRVPGGGGGLHSFPQRRKPGAVRPGPARPGGGESPGGDRPSNHRAPARAPGGDLPGPPPVPHPV